MRMSAHLSFPNLTVQNMSQTLSSAIERPIGLAEHTGMVFMTMTFSEHARFFGMYLRVLTCSSNTTLSLPSNTVSTL